MISPNTHKINKLADAIELLDNCKHYAQLVAEHPLPKEDKSGFLPEHLIHEKGNAELQDLVLDIQIRAAKCLFSDRGGVERINWDRLRKYGYAVRVRDQDKTGVTSIIIVTEKTQIVVTR